MPEAHDGPGATEVFVSYRARSSSTVAALLRKSLLERHVSVFLDFDKIRPGDPWRDVIDQALQAENLAVGIVLMEDDWFTSFAPDLADDVVFHEVTALLDRVERDGVTLLPVRLHEPDDPAGRPPPPPPPGARELADLHRRLGDLHWFTVEKRGFHHMDELTDAVVDRVRTRALDQRLHQGLRAEELPPQPLCRLRADVRLRQGLRHWADSYEAFQEDVRTATIQGQESLSARRFRQAQASLERAWWHAMSGRSPAPLADPLRRAAWAGQAANMLVIAALGGNRPRRLKLATASRLLTEVLLPAVASLADAGEGFEPVPAADDDHMQAGLVESFASVAEMTLSLFGVVWSDYFVTRDVETPRPRSGRHAWRDDVQRLRSALERFPGPRWTAEELSTLLDEDYFSGLQDIPPQVREFRDTADLAG